VTASAPRIVSPYNRPNDKFGYAVYSVVVFATPEQQSRVQAVRDAVRAQRSMMPAHVTVKGTFCEIPQLDRLKSVIRHIASSTGKFTVEFEPGVVLGKAYDTGEGWAGVQIRKTPGLVACHDAMYGALAPVTTNAYGNEQGDDYHPHVTVFHEPLPELKQLGKKLAATTDLGAGFPVREVWLMGHVGPPYRGKWTPVESFPLIS
jgi:2'-5' RNA ligase superfamily